MGWNGKKESWEQQQSACPIQTTGKRCSSFILIEAE
jgi:hypothetical protein